MLQQIVVHFFVIVEVLAVFVPELEKNEVFQLKSLPYFVLLVLVVGVDCMGLRGEVGAGDVDDLSLPIGLQLQWG